MTVKEKKKLNKIIYQLETISKLEDKDSCVWDENGDVYTHQEVFEEVLKYLEMLKQFNLKEQTDD